MPCNPGVCLFSGPMYVIFSSVLCFTSLCSICSGDVYWWLNGIQVFIKLLVEKYAVVAQLIECVEITNDLPCLPQTNGTLNPNTFFYVGTEIFYSVQLPEAMGFFGLSTGPWSSQWFMVVQLTNYSTPSLCLWCEKESTLSLGEAWITMTLKEGRMDICTIPDARIKYFKQPNNSLYQWGVHQITRNLGPRVPQVSDHTIHSTWGVTYLSSLHVLGMSLDLPELPFSFEKCCAKSMILLGLLREILG